MSSRLKWILLSKLNDDGLTLYILQNIHWTTHLNMCTAYLKNLPNFKQIHVKAMLSKNRELACRYYGHFFTDIQVQNITYVDWVIASHYFKDHPAYKDLCGSDTIVSKQYIPK